MITHTTRSGAAALIAVTLVWAFSFGIIGRFLTGVDPIWIAFIRLFIATLCFLPVLKIGGLAPRTCLNLVAAGAVQFGIMYISYLAAYRFLEAWQVALFSVLTPLWIAIVDSIWSRQLVGKVFLAAFLSVAGAIVIRAGDSSSKTFWIGFLLMQVANLAFALGQVWFRNWKIRNPETPERSVFGLLYFGGLALATIALLFSGSMTNLPEFSLSQGVTLLYLGLVASGLGFFFWNYGASRVSVGFLAAANNLVVPTGIILAIFLTGKSPTWDTFLIGGALIATSLILGREDKPKATETPPGS